jgi:hypothetical protein
VAIAQAHLGRDGQSGGALADLLAVAAGAEGLAGARENHATHADVGVDAVHVREQRVDDVGRERVARLGIVQRQGDAAALLLVKHCLAHGFSLMFMT